VEIVVLVKPVPDGESRLRANAAGTQLDPEGIRFVLSGYDESAVEQALLLQEDVPGSSVRAIAFGPPPRTEEVLRAALALGVGKAIWVEAPPTGLVDPVGTARALALAIGRNPYDLVIAGKQALDDESGIVGPAVAELLGIRDIGTVVEVRTGADPKRLRIQRAVEGGIETHEAPLPVLLGLQQARNDPRTAKLPMILKSRRAPIDRIPWNDIAAQVGPPKTRSTGFRLPPPRTGAKMIAFETPQQAAERLVAVLRDEAK
jgi:electron transfer flavoprotein beta subunit